MRDCDITGRTAELDVLEIRRERAIALLGMYERCAVSLAAQVAETCDRLGVTLAEWRSMSLEEREAMLRADRRRRKRRKGGTT